MKANAFINLSREYDAVTGEAKIILDDLQKDYESSISSNTFYQKNTAGKLVKAIIWLIVIGFILFVDEGIAYLPYSWFEWSTSEYLGELTLIALKIFGLLNIYTIFRFFYSKGIEKYQGRVTKIREEVQQRIDAMRQSNFYQNTLAKLSKGEHVVSEHPNDIGEKIASLHDEMWNTVRKSQKVDKVLRIILAVVIYLLGFIIFYQHESEWKKFTDDAVFWVSALGLYYCFAVDLIIIKVGQYMGKRMRSIGCLLVAIYGIVLHMMIGDKYTSLGISGALIKESDFLAGVFSVANVIIFFQVLGLLIGVWNADFLGMKQKWEAENFQLQLSYGGNKTKTKWSVVRRTLLMICFLAFTCELCSEGSGVFLVVFPFTWWVTNPLMKPFGSTLYQYYGKSKCIGMQFLFFGILLASYIERQGYLTMDDFVEIGISFVLYLILGGIAKALNDGTRFFEFMHHFI